MKYPVITLILLIVLLGCSESSTGISESNGGIAATSSDQRKAQISALLNLQDETAFWKIYADYEKDINAVLKQHAELSEKFNGQYSCLLYTSDAADE